VAPEPPDPLAVIRAALPRQLSDARRVVQSARRGTPRARRRTRGATRGAGSRCCHPATFRLIRGAAVDDTLRVRSRGLIDEEAAAFLRISRSCRGSGCQRKPELPAVIGAQTRTLGDTHLVPANSVRQRRFSDAEILRSLPRLPPLARPADRPRTEVLRARGTMPGIEHIRRVGPDTTKRSSFNETGWIRPKFLG
jgi:hypothetical protein